MDTAVGRTIRQTSKDVSNPLNSEFELLQSGLRFRVMRARRDVYKKPFIPHAIQALNMTSLGLYQLI